MEPKYVFPGDVVADYWAIEATPSFWLAIAEVAASASGAFGCVISSATAERWRRMSAAAYWLDGLLDNGRSDRAVMLYGLIVAGQPFEASEFADILPPQLMPVIRLLNTSLTGFSRVELVRPAMVIADYSARKARQCWLAPYLVGLIREGRQTGLLLGHCMTSQERRQPQATALVRWLRDMMAVGTLGDSTADLGDDFRTGLTWVYPSRDARCIMAIATLLGFAWLCRRPRVTGGAVVVAIRTVRHHPSR
jgi:hypothetical protein